MTEKLYEQNSLLRSCQATVLSCTEERGRFLVELDRTVFFPEGGGQLSDRGSIGGVRVEHVSEKDGRVYHECAQPLPVGAAVTAELDWAVRLDRMQQHLGEHLLSYACWKLFGANNIGFHMSEELVTIDLDKELSERELEEAELFTNRIIWEDRPVRVSYVESADAARLPLRKFNSKLTGVLRIVTVQDADSCTCCGTHPPTTGMLGSVRILRREKHKQGQRLEFACGGRALKDAMLKNKIILAAGAALSSKAEDVPQRIFKLQAEISRLQEELKEKTSSLLAVKLREAAERAQVTASGIRIVCVEAEDARAARLLLPLAAALRQALTVILVPQPERLAYSVVPGLETTGDCRELIKVLNEAFGGRGGGKADFAQGGAPATADWRSGLAKAMARLAELP